MAVLSRPTLDHPLSPALNADTLSDANVRGGSASCPSVPRPLAAGTGTGTGNISNSSSSSSSSSAVAVLLGIDPWASDAAVRLHGSLAHGRPASVSPSPTAAPTEPPAQNSVGTGARPSVVVHTIAPSDTLEGICVMYGVRAADVKRHNKLWTNDSLYLRKTLEIPLAGPAAASLSPLGSGSASASPSHGSASGMLKSMSPQLADSTLAQSDDLYQRQPYRSRLSEERRYSTESGTSLATTSSTSNSGVSSPIHRPASIASATTPSLPPTPSPQQPKPASQPPPTVSELLQQIDSDVNHILDALEQTFLDAASRSPTPTTTNVDGSIYPPPAPSAAHSIARIVRSTSPTSAHHTHSHSHSHSPMHSGGMPSQPPSAYMSPWNATHHVQADMPLSSLSAVPSAHMNPNPHHHHHHSESAMSGYASDHLNGTLFTPFLQQYVDPPLQPPQPSQQQPHTSFHLSYPHNASSPRPLAATSTIPREAASMLYSGSSSSASASASGSGSRTAAAAAAAARDSLWAASSSTARVKILPLGSQAAAAQTASAAPLHVLFEWTPLFTDVLPPDVQQTVEENLKGRLRRQLSRGDVDRHVVLERVPDELLDVDIDRGDSGSGSGSGSGSAEGGASGSNGAAWHASGSGVVLMLRSKLSSKDRRAGEWVGMKDL